MELKKVLGFKTILLITINSIIGTGIFFLPAVGIEIAGPASLLSWAIMSVIALYIAMIFSELVSMFPKAGGLYEYAKHAFGRFASFLIGWTLFIAGNITTAMLIVGGIHYLAPHAPVYLKIAICLLFIAIFNFIAYRGLKTSAVMLTTFSVITLSVLIGIIFPGLFKISHTQFSPFLAIPFPLIVLAIFFIAETFFGWESALFLAEETKDARSTMPRALIYGTGAVAVLSIGLTIVAIGSGLWKSPGGLTAPIADLGQLFFGTSGYQIFTIATYIAIVGAVACWVVSAPRLLVALARDKLFLPQFKKLHPKFGSPSHAIIFQAIVTSVVILIGFGSYQQLLSLLVPLMLLLYSLVAIALLVLRFKRPDIERLYKAPKGEIGAVLIVCICLGLIAMWLTHEPYAWETLRLSFSLIMLGIPFYFLIEMYYDPTMVREVDDILAYFVLFTEKIALPKKVKKQILVLLGDLQTKTVLEFGCSVGTLTLDLGTAVGSHGKVYATDISKNDLKITKKRLEMMGHSHVQVIHDEQHSNRIHPQVPPVDAVVSVGMVGYLQDVKNVLLQLNKRLKLKSRVVFVDYDKFFRVIPNIDWLADNDRIRKVFASCGFNVNVIRKQGLLWQYIYIYGIKYKNV